MKRIICAVVIMFMIFTGCSEDNDGQTSQFESSTVPSMDIRSITICLISTGMEDQPRNLKSIEDMLEELNNKTENEIYTRIQLEWLPWTSYDKDLIRLLESGDAPDAFYIDEIDDLYSKGLTKDITDIFPYLAPNYFKTLLDTRSDELPKSCIYEGRIYAIPSNRLISSRYNVIAREDLVNRYLPGGIDDLDDYCTFLKAVRENEHDVLQGSVHFSDFVNAYVTGNGYYFLDVQQTLLCKWDDDDINPVYKHDTYEFSVACDLFKELMSENTLAVRGTKSSIRDGTLASVLGPMLGMHGEYASAYKYSVYPLYLDSYYDWVDSQFTIGISSSSQNADRVILFIEWLQSSQENYDLFMYGLEGKNYRLIDNHLDFFYSRDTIASWPGNFAFINYLLERPYAYEPEDYPEFVKKCALVNTKTKAELFLEKGYDIDTNDVTEMTVEALKHLNGYFKEYMNYCDTLDQGITVKENFNEIIEVKGLQNELDKVFDLYTTWLKENKIN